MLGNEDKGEKKNFFKLYKEKFNEKQPNELCKPASAIFHKFKSLGFPGGAVVKNLTANAGDTGSGPGPGRSHMPRSN